MRSHDWQYLMDLPADAKVLWINDCDKKTTINPNWNITSVNVVDITKEKIIEINSQQHYHLVRVVWADFRKMSMQIVRELASKNNYLLIYFEFPYNKWKFKNYMKITQLDYKEYLAIPAFDNPFYLLDKDIMVLQYSILNLLSSQYRVRKILIFIFRITAKSKIWLSFLTTIFPNFVICKTK